MKFLLDAHIPPSLCSFIELRGHTAIHTKYLPNQNETFDSEIIQFAIARNMIVITKDSDFYHSFLTRREPQKLLFVKTGNIKTKELKELFESYFDRIIDAFYDHDLIEIHRDYLVI